MVSGKNRNFRFPLELLNEIVNVLPLNLKWEDFRVSSDFDIFLLRNQCQWVIYFKKNLKPISENLALVKTRFEYFANNLGSVTTQVNLLSLNKQCNLAYERLRLLCLLLVEGQPAKLEELDNIEYPARHPNLQNIPLKNHIGVIRGLVSSKFPKLVAMLDIGNDSLAGSGIEDDDRRVIFADLFTMNTTVGIMGRYFT
uniref:Uncharacterized protein n=1 Tax=Meloidogyne enterolobii TaxID=390850 RepID=A0A6V7U9F2_MELEN|nr:unnamed protein product [Meloidogyne enterolobii]